MPDAVTVGKVGDFRDGVARAFDVEGRRIAVACVGERWYAFEDTCTHAQCSLSDGDVEGGSIVCPCHQGEFDMKTGQVLSGPPPSPIETFTVTVEGDDIVLERPGRRVA